MPKRLVKLALPQILWWAKVREALLEHLREGRLALSRLLDTARWLSGGETSRPNWARVAIFGYYAGTTLSIAAIAKQLARSEGSVKKHISAIRAAFGVRGRGGRDTGREEVRQRALAEEWWCVGELGTFPGVNGDFAERTVGALCGGIELKGCSWVDVRGYRWNVCHRELHRHGLPPRYAHHHDCQIAGNVLK